MVGSAAIGALGLYALRNRTADNAVNVPLRHQLARMNVVTAEQTAAERIFLQQRQKRA